MMNTLTLYAQRTEGNTRQITVAGSGLGSAAAGRHRINLHSPLLSVSIIRESRAPTKGMNKSVLIRIHPALLSSSWRRAFLGTQIRFFQWFPQPLSLSLCHEYSSSYPPAIPQSPQTEDEYYPSPSQRGRAPQLTCHDLKCFWLGLRLFITTSPD